MKKKNPFTQKIINIIEWFNKTKVKTPQVISRLLSAHILSHRSHQTHGGLNVDKKTWGRLKALRRRAKYLRGLNRRDRTSGGKG